MKKTLPMLLPAMLSIAALFLTSCTQKDRVKDIVGDLDAERYSLHFDEPLPDGIKQTSYGAESYLAFADPQDLICPDPIRIKFKKIPVFRFPKRVFPPTCPDMVWDPQIFQRLEEVLVSIKSEQLAGLHGVALDGGGKIFATDMSTKYYASLQTDILDDSLQALDGSKYIMLTDFSDPMPGISRDFYGYGDINQLVLMKYKLKLKDILKPKLKGCFDPQILEELRSKLIAFNPEVFKSLEVVPLEQDKSIGILQ